MSKKSALGFMMTYVQEYLDGARDRLSFDLDFNDHLTKHYSKMERECGDLADCFAFYLSEQGFEQVQGLSDVAHKKRIRKQFSEFKAAMHDGIL